MDFKKLTYEELINYCKDNNIDYLTKQKKPYAHKTLLTKLKNPSEPKADKEVNDDDTKEDNLDSIVKKCHNYLYRSSRVVGPEAQNDIMKILVIAIFNELIKNNNEYIHKLINNFKTDKNNILSYLYDKYDGKIENVTDEDEKDLYQNALYHIDYLTDIKQITVYKNKDIKEEWKLFITDCLSKILPNIYDKDDYSFNTPNDYDIVKLIEIISSFKITTEFINNFAYFNGDIHESFLKYQGNTNSKELGQYFTPRTLIKAILDDCGLKELITNIEIDNPTIYDPCMGTAGLLCYTYNNCNNKIKPNDIYGLEIHKHTIKFGIASLMISTNNYNNNIRRCNSLVENDYLFENKKFDIIFTNPPFGTKNDYKQLNKLFDDYKKKDYNESLLTFKDIYPVITNKGTSLFIQNIIYSLAENGIGCIVLPDGELMTSISKDCLNIRRFILDNAKIIKIINVNGGIFMNTGIKTKVLILQKGNYDNYNCEIDFLDIVNDGNEITVKHLETKKLNENLQFSSSIKDDGKELNYNKDIEIKTLGEVCEFLPKSKRQASYGNKEGKYPFYTSSQDCSKYCDEYDYKDECLILGTGGNANIKYSNNFSCSTDNFIIKIKTGQLIKYIYYYILLNIEILEKGFIGVGIKHISKDYITNIQIPIPSLKLQEEIVEYLDFIYDESNKNSKTKIEDLKKLNKYYLKLNTSFIKDIETKTLGEVCKVNQGTYIKTDMKINGEYPVYGGGNVSYYINQYNREDEIIVAKDGISADCVRYEKNKFFLNHHGWTIHCYELIIKKYIYYYLVLIQPKLLSIAKGAAQLGINQENFYKLEIPIPSIEKQKEMVEYLDFNENLISQLEKEIENNKKQAELFMAKCLI